MTEIIHSPEIDKYLNSNRKEVIQQVRYAYDLFSIGSATEADPAFLSFAHDNTARIIAKPARIDDDDPVAGLKWVSSFPNNLLSGKPRAGGILILNDSSSGEVRAIFDVASINSHRTAASAVLALACLRPAVSSNDTICIIGCGHIATEITQYLSLCNSQPRRWVLYDTNLSAMEKLKMSLEGQQQRADVAYAKTAEAAIQRADVIVLTTTEKRPFLTGEKLFRSDQTVLHISLRDLGADVIANANNYTDCPKLGFTQNTSLGLAESTLGHRQYFKGGIKAVLRAPITSNRPIIFSPFGLAILDLYLARWIYNQVC